MMMIKNIKKYGIGGLLISSGFALSLLSCTADYLAESPAHDLGEASLEFKATLFDTEAAGTRALTQNPVNVQPNVYKGNFYIEINDPYYVPKNGDSSNPGAYKFGKYIVPKTGNGGMLTFDGPLESKPNWYDVDENHKFWSWTVPTQQEAEDNTQYPEDPEDPDDSDTTDPGNGGGESGTEPSEPGTRDDPDPDNMEPLNGNTLDYKTYVPSRRPIKYTLQNTNVTDFIYKVEGEGANMHVDSLWSQGSWGNGYFLETLVGAESGPYNYRNNGPEVPLQFRHLVSKISLRSMLFYGSDGSTHDNFKANITFINMPTEFTVYPHPTPEDGQPDNLPPVAITNYGSANPYGGITFGLTNPVADSDIPLNDQIDYRDKFYICPEVDFKDVQYKVELVGVDPKYTNRGEYWGDFKNVVFERDPELAPDYDNPADPDNPDSYIDDSTILHAGEIMYFDLIVRQSGGGGTRIYVGAWNDLSRKSKHYQHPGIYDSGVAIEITGASGDNGWAEKYDVYGDGYWNGGTGPASTDNPGIFQLYSDIERTNSMSYAVNSKYVLNGNGYTLTLTRTGESYNISIGKMVDIYIQVGDYMIYIDPEGLIFQYDPTTNVYEPTGGGIDVTGTKGSYSIDIRTGKIN